MNEALQLNLSVDENRQMFTLKVKGFFFFPPSTRLPARFQFF